jgi:aspartate carbamoyltransferase catalytic subunit
MHPGPIYRGIELDDEAADGEKSVISAQFEYGLFVRMASLYWAFDPPETTGASAEDADQALAS